MRLFFSSSLLVAIVSGLVAIDESLSILVLDCFDKIIPC